MANFTYDIIDHIATLSNRGAWILELNLISWNGRTPTFDLRRWSEDHSKMSKGTSLTRQELDALAQFLAENPI